MILVAFDTSTESCSVALQMGDDIRVDHRVVPRAHAALLLPMLNGLLSEFDLQPKQIEGVVFGRGPGSFTGVRIAAAAAQGLAMAANCGVCGVSSLQAMVQGCVRTRMSAGESTELIMVALDARMDQIYTALYQLTENANCNGLVQLTEEAVVDPEAFALPNNCGDTNSVTVVGGDERLPQKIVVCGSGAERYEAVIQRRLQWISRQESIFQPNIYPHAQDLLTLIDRAEAIHWQSPDQAQPVYLRNKVALTEAERSSA